MKIKKKEFIRMTFFLFNIFLSGCNSAVLDPKGQIGLQQRSLILTSFFLMLIVVVPAVLMAVYFSWKYHEKNKASKYNPNWSHSLKCEAVIWTVPVLIILFLATLTWKSTHLLEPSKPIKYKEKPITIEVISMDWKWLFIYPEKNIASINEIAFPSNTPIHFQVTSNSVMNSFFIPNLGSQIYAMAGMRTSLYLDANKPGIYNGISASYSGSGFSDMKFKVITTKNHLIFNQWITRAKKSSKTINNMTEFESIATPSVHNKAEYFSSVKPNLFKDVINKFTNYKTKQQQKF